MLKADNLPPSCAVVTKSGNLNFLEPSGLVQTSNGTALPLPLIYVEMFVALYLCFGIVTSIGHDNLPAMLSLMFVISYALKIWKSKLQAAK